MIDWKGVLAQLVAAAIPRLVERLPEIIDAIFGWLKGASEEDAVAVGKNLGKMIKAAQSELA